MAFTIRKDILFYIFLYFLIVFYLYLSYSMAAIRVGLPTFSAESQCQRSMQSISCARDQTTFSAESAKQRAHT